MNLRAQRTKNFTNINFGDIRSIIRNCYRVSERFPVSVMTRTAPRLTAFISCIYEDFVKLLETDGLWIVFDSLQQLFKFTHISSIIFSMWQRDVASNVRGQCHDNLKSIAAIQINSIIFSMCMTCDALKRIVSPSRTSSRIFFAASSCVSKV